MSEQPKVRRWVTGPAKDETGLRLESRPDPMSGSMRGVYTITPYAWVCNCTDDDTAQMMVDGHNSQFDAPSTGAQSDE